MPTYKVLHSHILHDGVLYAPGEVIELKENQAEGLSVSLSEDADPVATGRRGRGKSELLDY